MSAYEQYDDESTDLFDVIVTKTMLYLKEILFVLGLILLLIILVRVALWLWKCGFKGDGRDSRGSFRNRHNRHLRGKRENGHQENIYVDRETLDNNKEKLNKKQKKKKNKDKEDTPPPPPVPKPDDLEDKDGKLPDDNIPEPGQPEFVIVEGQQLPRPDVDPRLSIAEEAGSAVASETVSPEEATSNDAGQSPQTKSTEQLNEEIVVIEMDPNNCSEKTANEDANQTVVVTLPPDHNEEQTETANPPETIIISQMMASPENIQNQTATASNDEPIYAEIIRKSVESTQDKESEPQLNNDNHETVQLVEHSKPEAQSKPRILQRRTIIRKVRRASSSIYDDDDSSAVPSSKEDQPQATTTTIGSIRKTPPVAHRCICPYCSNTALSTASSFTSTKHHQHTLAQPPKTSEQEQLEQMEVLNGLDETIENMERITQTLATAAQPPEADSQNDDKNLNRISYDSETLEQELEETVQQFEQEVQQQLAENSSVKTNTPPAKPNRQTVKKEEPKTESSNAEQPESVAVDSSYYTTDKNRVIKIDAIYKKEAAKEAKPAPSKMPATPASPPVLPPVKSAAAAAKGLVKNRMRAFEPYIQYEHQQTPSNRVVPNWIRNVGKGGARGVVNGIGIRPELPPKPTVMVTREVRVPVIIQPKEETEQKTEEKPKEDKEIVQSENEANLDEEIVEEIEEIVEVVEEGDEEEEEKEAGQDPESNKTQTEEKLPQCAIYAQVIDQIKKRQSVQVV